MEYGAAPSRVYARRPIAHRAAARSTERVGSSRSAWLWIILAGVVVVMFVMHAMTCQQSARMKELNDLTAELRQQVRRDEDRLARTINPQRIAQEAALRHMVEMEPPQHIPVASQPVRTASVN